MAAEEVYHFNDADGNMRKWRDSTFKTHLNAIVESCGDVYMKLQAQFKSRGYDLKTVCDGTKRCWLFEQLFYINETLMIVSMELAETMPDEFSLMKCNSANYKDSEASAFVLIYILLRFHRCITTVWFSANMCRNSYLRLISLSFSPQSNVHCLKIENRWYRDPNAYISRGVSVLKNVETLVLTNLIMTYATLITFISMLKNCPLKHIILLYNELHYDQVLCAICSNASKLKTLVYINNSQIGSQGRDAIIELLKSDDCVLENLLIIRLFDTEQDGLKFMEALALNKTLKVLKLKYCKMTSNVVCALGEILKVNTLLETLNISCNMIDETGAMYLANAIKRNKTLKRLCFSDNAGTPIVVGALAENTTLRKLKLNCLLPGTEVENMVPNLNVYDRVFMSINIFDVDRLCESIAERLQHFRELSVYLIGFTGQSCLVRLFTLLCHAPKLEIIKFRMDNEFGMKEAEAFATLISTSRSLKKIMISNKSNQNVLEVILLGLASNKSITHFIWRPCMLTEKKVAEAFVAVVRDNPTLCHFNGICGSSNVYQLIAHAINGNRTIRSIDFCWPIPSNVHLIFRIQETLRRNTSFQSRAVAALLDPTVLAKTPGVARTVEYLLYNESFKTFFNEHINRDFDELSKRLKRYIANNYFWFSGVCKDIGRCTPLFNYECWSNICSFVRLTEVKHDPLETFFKPWYKTITRKRQRED